MLQEENESLLEKVRTTSFSKAISWVLRRWVTLIFLIELVYHFNPSCSRAVDRYISFQLRLAEERCEEAEARARQLEQQVNLQEHICYFSRIS